MKNGRYPCTELWGIPQEHPVARENTVFHQVYTFNCCEPPKPTGLNWGCSVLINLKNTLSDHIWYCESRTKTAKQLQKRPTKHILVAVDADQQSTVQNKETTILLMHHDMQPKTLQWQDCMELISILNDNLLKNYKRGAAVEEDQVMRQTKCLCSNLRRLRSRQEEITNMCF